MTNIKKFRLRQFLSVAVVLVILSGFAGGFDTAPHFDLTRTEDWRNSEAEKEPQRELEAKAEQEKLERERLEKIQFVKEAQQKAEQERLLLKQDRLTGEKLEKESAEKNRFQMSILQITPSIVRLI